MPPTGYSGTPLAKKLSLKPGMRASVIAAPDDYHQLLAPEPEAIEWLGPRARRLDFVHYFVKREAELAKRLPRQLARIVPAGMIWISWPKKASPRKASVPTDMTEDTVRKHALPLGLVDIKVCAVDEVWSGLKLVIRRENR